MPKIFEYLGIIIFFYSNEHEPIHVHGKKGEFESKAEFIITNREIIEIRIKVSKGFKPLKGSDLKNFKDFCQITQKKLLKNGLIILYIIKTSNLNVLTKNYNENY